MYSSIVKYWACTNKIVLMWSIIRYDPTQVEKASKNFVPFHLQGILQWGILYSNKKEGT